MIHKSKSKMLLEFRDFRSPFEVTTHLPKLHWTANTKGLWIVRRDSVSVFLTLNLRDQTVRNLQVWHSTYYNQKSNPCKSHLSEHSNQSHAPESIYESPHELFVRENVALFLIDFRDFIRSLFSFPFSFALRNDAFAGNLVCEIEIWVERNPQSVWINFAQKLWQNIWLHSFSFVAHGCDVTYKVSHTIPNASFLGHTFSFRFRFLSFDFF